LGKTIQAISLILYLKEAGLMTDQQGKPRPALVAVPPGLISNWQREFEKWAGQTLVVHSYYGHKRAVPPNKGVGVDVVLTSYHTLRLDVNKFVDPELIGFSSMILDEAQHIKNPKALITRVVKQIGSIVGHSRFALSGTPVENKMDELHSIHDFVNFGYLGSQETFQRDFSRRIEQKKNNDMRQEAITLLKRLVDPFQLRRLKTDKSILPDLPDCIGFDCPVELSDIQKKFYTAAQEEFKNKLQTSREQAANHSFERRGHIFAMLEKCRMICCHPAALVPEKRPTAIADVRVVPTAASESGKCVRLLELLDEIITANEKVLVFAMRRRVLDLLQDMISAKFRAAKVLKMTGEVAVKDRREIEQSFQNDEDCKVLLLTIGVGGVGLNLTAASHVIHFDRCYNPAKEAQATGRAHRLGQRHAVCVHTMVTSGTFEERLDEIMQEKAELSNLTVTSVDDWIAHYDDEQVRELFMLRSSSNRNLGPTGQASAASSSKASAASSSKASPASSSKRQKTSKSKSGLLEETGGTQNSSSSGTQNSALEACAAAASSSTSASSHQPKKKRRQAEQLSVDKARSTATKDAEDLECTICMDGPASQMLLPCGHQCLCGDCVGLVEKCPICRADIQQRIQMSVARGS